jgi:hypothetical protein
VAKQGFWLRFNHSWDPRVVPIRNFQTVSLGNTVSKGQVAFELWRNRNPTLCYKSSLSLNLYKPVTYRLHSSEYREYSLGGVYDCPRKAAPKDTLMLRGAA